MTTSQPSQGALHTLLTDLAMGESARWYAGRFWLADWGTGEILAVDGAGVSEVIARAPTAPCCFDWLPDGRMLIVSGREGQLLRQEPDGLLTPYANLAALSEHPWNEIVVDGRGNAYMNTIGFDFPGGPYAPGSVALVSATGAVRQVADGVAFPNGMAVTPDGRTLILAESYGQCLTAFDIADDGSLVNRRVWAPLDGGYPDGICLDAEGAIWYADVGNQRCVRVREGGEVLAIVDAGRGCFSCALSDERNPTLFMVTAEWGGPEGMADGRRTGQVQTHAAPAPGARWKHQEAS